MSSSGKISSSGGHVKSTDTILGNAIKGVSPVLKRFYKFTKEMAQHFSRHMAKDRSEEFIDAVNKEFK